jgi:hypothetical protein
MSSFSISSLTSHSASEAYVEGYAELRGVGIAEEAADETADGTGIV